MPVVGVRTEELSKHAINVLEIKIIDINLETLFILRLCDPLLRTFISPKADAALTTFLNGAVTFTMI